MVNGRKRKCVCCGEPIEDFEPSVPYKNRYAHERCFNVAIKAIHVDKKQKLEEARDKKKPEPKVKAKAELKDGMSEEEYKKKKAYYDYLRSLIGDENMGAKVYAYSERMIEKHNFTFESMHNTLVYLHEILEREIVGDGVGIIPYYHDEAKKYYEELQRIEEENKTIDVGNMYRQSIVVVKNPRRNVQQIDINLI